MSGDEVFRARAVERASRCVGRTGPRPAVGAVLVRGRGIISQADSLQAEHPPLKVLEKAGGRAAGGTLYVTLAPGLPGAGRACCQAIVRSGIRRLVFGARNVDKDAGVRFLRRQGLEVSGGVLERESREGNEGYYKHARCGLPHVVLTLSATLDGKLATASGASQWISSEESRRAVHVLRDRLDAILVGSGTVLIDNPRLTCRLPGGRDPIRVVMDRRFRVSPEATVFTQPSPVPTLVLVGREDPEKEAALRARGHKVICLPVEGEEIPWVDALRALAAEGIRSVLVEGGAHTAASILRARAADELMLFLAPLLIGGDGLDMIAPIGVRALTDGLSLRDMRIQQVGRDLLIRAAVAPSQAQTHPVVMRKAS